MRYIRKEIGKLISYAKALNINVYFSDFSGVDSSAEWSMDGTTITIYRAKPLRSYLLLLHELAHHKKWLYDGKKVPLKTNKIFDKFNNDSMSLTKAQRKIIYETERVDSAFQYDIHYETQSKVPIDIIKKEITIDLWIYRYFYLKGKWPLLKDIREFRRKL